MPPIVDPDGPGGRPISVFESGAILQYLGETGQFYPAGERARTSVDEWLFWQMATSAEGWRGQSFPSLCAGTAALRA